MFFNTVIIIPMLYFNNKRYSSLFGTNSETLQMYPNYKLQSLSRKLHRYEIFDIPTFIKSSDINFQLICDGKKIEKETIADLLLIRSCLESSLRPTVPKVSSYNDSLDVSSSYENEAKATSTSSEKEAATTNNKSKRGQRYWSIQRLKDCTVG